MKPPESDSQPVTDTPSVDLLSRRTIASAVALIAAAWILSGGCGLLARPLAAGLAWCCLAIVGAALQPSRKAGVRLWGLFVGGLAVAVLATASMDDVVRLAGLGIGAAILSAVAKDPIDRRMLRVAAQAIAALALYRLALTSIPLVWHISDAVANALGSLASFFWGSPLSVGPTFAGIDHLVIMTVLIAGWARELKRLWLRPVVLAVAAVIVGQGLYLLCLSQAAELASSLPTAPAAPTPDPYVPPDWHWPDAAKSLIPWNMPVLAVIWHLCAVALMLRLTEYRREKPAAATKHREADFDWQPWTAVALAGLLPLICVLSPGKSDLAGKTVLAFNEGFLDWDVPVHGRYGADSSGRFGMLPAFVESLGGRFQRSSQLTAEELSGADVLILIHPNQPWPAERLSRVHDYVRQGGSLLVAAGPRMQDLTGASSYNEVLEPLNMPVRYDTAVSQNEAWRHGIQRWAHPTTLGLGDDRDRFGLPVAASVELPWRAAPLLVGRWGWSEPGSDFLLTERARWDPGERLGDLVLAGERRLGSGRVVVLGDNACLTNQGTVRAYRFTGRLLSYLARGSLSPQAWWRQLAALAVAGGLIVLLARSPRWEVLAAALLALVLVSAFAAWSSCRTWEVFPDGTKSTPNNLAYIDASHLEAYAETQWAADGVDGLALTLMRDGLLVLAADDLSHERLRRAGLLVSIAPSRHFTSGERRRIGEFVEDGGTLISIAGATDGRRANELLSQFGLHVPEVYHGPGSPRSDALPFGCFYRPYPDSENHSIVLFHAAWPLTLDRKRGGLASLVSAESAAGTPQAIVARSRAGKGSAIAIADTCFAMNKTLEGPGGETLGGDRANAYFWRWLIGQLPGHEPWQPPRIQPGVEESVSDAVQASGEEEQP